MDAKVLARYFDRIGSDGSDTSLAHIQGAHVRSIPYENFDIHLERDITLDVDSLVRKIVDRRRGGYCYEQNTLFAAVLEALGYAVTRCLGRVRLADPTSARPATHMVLLVDGQVVDVGFGAANPLGPIPLGGEATYGWCTWKTTRVVSPEGEDVWLVSLFDMPLYTFTEAPQHPVDYVAPNWFSSTHPLSIFTQHTIVQRWDGDSQVGLINGELTERKSDLTNEVTVVDASELGVVLRARFDLDLDDDELARLSSVVARGSRDP